MSFVELGGLLSRESALNSPEYFKISSDFCFSENFLLSAVSQRMSIEICFSVTMSPFYPLHSSYFWKTALLEVLSLPSLLYIIEFCRRSNLLDHPEKARHTLVRLPESGPALSSAQEMSHSSLPSADSSGSSVLTTWESSEDMSQNCPDQETRRGRAGFSQSLPEGFSWRY